MPDMGLITHPHNQSNWGITGTKIEHFVLQLQMT